MKKINQKEWARVQSLHTQLSDHFSDPQRQSFTIWRGDWRAIQWATWWIRETIEAEQRLTAQTDPRR